MNQPTFRVGTFNLANLVLPNHVFYLREHYSKEAYAKKKLWVAGQLERMRADIIGFQEVFHEQALREVLDASICKGFHLVAADAVGDHPAVALATRFPVVDYQIIRDFPRGSRLAIQGAEIPLSHFSHPVLSVRLQLTKNIECTVFVVHLKSKRGIFPEGVDRHDPVELAKAQARALMLRAAESIALRVLLMDVLENRNYPVIVIGDLNDGGTAVTSQIISGESPHRKMDPDYKQQIWDVLLYHVKDIQARQSIGNFYYTHIHNGYYESLDHIMVSQEFVTQNPKRIGRVAYVSLLNDHLLDETLSPEEIPQWQSDHGQVVVSIELEREQHPRRMQVLVKSRTEVTRDRYTQESTMKIEKDLP